jgi:anaerobic magnesium-protoporphyrin IX monomethyl ester cyclase
MKRITRSSKIVLINPVSPFLNDQNVFPPLGILYIASTLREMGFNPEAIDLGLYEDWETKADNIRGEIIGITSTTPQFLNMPKLLKILKRNNPESFLISGGNHATAFPEKCLELGFSCAVTGEGESAIKSIMQDLLSGKKPEKIVRFPYMENIDSIPFPARDLIPIKNYNFLIEGKNAVSFLSSRGCPFKCAFCSNNVWGKKVRQRSVENVITEIEKIKNELGFDRVVFIDDTFSINKKRVYGISEGLKRLGIKWRCFIRANNIDFDMLKNIKDSGCVEVGIGIESGSQIILDNVNKGTTVEMNSNAINLCKKAGIAVKAFLIIGLPGETRSTVDETKKWLIKNKPDNFDLNIYMPYAQSEIWEHDENFDINFDKSSIKNSWFKGKEGQLNCYVATSGLSSAEILDLHDRVLQEVYSDISH